MGEPTYLEKQQVSNPRCSLFCRILRETLMFLGNVDAKNVHQRTLCGFRPIECLTWVLSPRSDESSRWACCCKLCTFFSCHCYLATCTRNAPEKGRPCYLVPHGRRLETFGVWYEADSWLCPKAAHRFMALSSSSSSPMRCISCITTCISLETLKKKKQSKGIASRKMAFTA